MRAEPKSSASTFTRQCGGDQLARPRERVVELRRVLASGAGHRRPASPASADDRRDLADDVAGANLLGDRVVEVRDEVHRPVLARAEHDGRRRLPLLEAVGEVEQRVGRQPFDGLGDHGDTADHLDLGLDVGRRRGCLAARLLRLLAQLDELAAQLVELARTALEHRPGLTRRDGLDPAGARADGAFAEQHERADLGGRADVRAAAQLGRVAVDLDDAHDLAVLLAEERHRAELPRLGDRRLERADRQRREDLLVDDPLDAARSSAVRACGCVKSKRSLSGRTAEPACLTWSPRTSRRAWCSRCVAVWFAIVGKRVDQAATARTRSPAAKPAPSNTSAWSSPSL